MGKSTETVGVLLIALCGALVSAVLRSYQLIECLDKNGLLLVGNPVMYLIAAILGVFVLAIALFCRRLNRLPGGENCFSAAPGYMLASGLSGVVIAVGCALRLTQGTTTAELIIYLVGIVSGLLLLAAAIVQGRGKKPAFVFFGVPCAFMVARLIIDFKYWSTDPAVADFCFLLLTGVCGMIAILNISGFCFDLGKRRATIFWCLCAAMFAFTSLPDYLLITGDIDLARLLVTYGIALWCLSYALQLLRRSVQEPEQPAEEAVPEMPSEAPPEA